jgi:hypothetical protein
MLLQLFSDPSQRDLDHYFQAGSVAAYEHIAMIRLHYSISDVLDECVLQLETGQRSSGHEKPQEPIRISSGKIDAERHFLPPKMVRSALSSDNTSNPTAESIDWIDLDRRIHGSDTFIQ